MSYASCTCDRYNFAHAREPDCGIAGVKLVKMDVKDSLAQRRYSCARHGEHDATMHIRTYARPGASGQRDVQLDRVYCMHCYIEALAKMGVREMYPVK